MAIPLVVNGQTFEYPVDFDSSWGVQATGWAQAVTNGMLQRAGGNFPLLADIDFGDTFGLIATYFTSDATNPATSGTIRLASADPGIAFRNNANSGNLILTTDASDDLVYTNGLKLTGNLTIRNDNAVNFQDTGSVHTIGLKSPSTTANYTLTLPPNSGSVGQFLRTDGAGTTTWVNAAGGGTVDSGTGTHLAWYASTGTTIDSLLDITYSASQLRISPPGGITTPSIYLQGVGAGSSTTISFETNGTTIALQGRTDGTFKITDVSDSHDILVYNSPFSAPFLSTSLPLNMSNPIDMGSSKITSLATGSAASDAANTGQVSTRLALAGGTMSGAIAMGGNKITGLGNATAAQDAVAFAQVLGQRIIQVATNQSTTQATTSSSSYASTNLQVSIAPSKTSSKIFVIATGVGVVAGGTQHGYYGLSGTANGELQGSGFYLQEITAASVFTPCMLMWLDNPATTSLQTYTVRQKNDDGVAMVNFGNTNNVQYIAAFEIG